MQGFQLGALVTTQSSPCLGRLVLFFLALLLCAGRVLAVSAQAPAETVSPLSPAPADPPNQEAADAPYEVALSEALDAHARGDFGRARTFMERAHALEPSARTLRGLGIVAFAQGRHADAIRFFDGSLASQIKPLPSDLRAGVEELRSHSWGQVGRFEVALDPPDATMLIDGAEPNFYESHVVILTPGRHLILVRAQGRTPFEVQVAVEPGAQRMLQIVLAPGQAQRVLERVVQVQVPAQGPPDNPMLRRRRRALWIGGMSLLGTGAAIYGTAFQRLQRTSERCEDMPGGGCTMARANGLYEGENIRELGMAGAVIGGLGVLTLIGATVFELRHRNAEHAASEVTTSLRINPQSVILHGAF